MFAIEKITLGREEWRGESLDWLIAHDSNPNRKRAGIRSRGDSQVI